MLSLLIVTINLSPAAMCDGLVENVNGRMGGRSIVTAALASHPGTPRTSNPFE